MKKLLVVLLLAGCANAQQIQKPATPYEISEDIRVYKNCLIPFAKSKDDGISDAHTIADGMRGACPDELNALIEDKGRGENGAVKQMLWQRKNVIADEIALSVVLDVRHANRK